MINVTWFDYSIDKMFHEEITQEQLDWLQRQNHIEVDYIEGEFDEAIQTAISFFELQVDQLELIWKREHIGMTDEEETTHLNRIDKYKNHIIQMEKLKKHIGKK